MPLHRPLGISSALSELYVLAQTTLLVNSWVERSTSTMKTERYEGTESHQKHDPDEMQVILVPVHDSSKLHTAI